jgi:esterase/lipase superfamily enzyme
MTPVTHYLITNRQIDLIDGQEVINPSGKERAGNAQISFRFARYTFDADDSSTEGTVELIPDLLSSDQTVETFSGVRIPMSADSAPERLSDRGRNLQDTEDLTGSNQVFVELFRSLKKDKACNVLFFIHGYKTDLSAALSTIRALHEKYVRPDSSDIQTIITFTWPSRKSLLLYLDDQYDAQLSGCALARVYQRLHDFLSELFQTTDATPCQKYIHLMCHSMGNQVLYYMLKQLRSQNLSHRETFKQIVLVGADVPYNAFDRDEPFNSLIDLGERVHVYYHRQDLALVASTVTKFRRNRLGRVGFKTSNSNEIPADVHEIDITEVPSKDNDSFLKNLLQFDTNELIQHWSYLSNQEVVKDINTVFSTGKSTFGVVSPPYR